MAAESGSFGPRRRTVKEIEQKNGIRPLALLLTVLSGLARLLPHPPNFTPVGAMSLFAGARLRGWWAYLVPLAMMAVTDPLLHLMFGMPGYTRLSPVIYASFMINVWIGRRLAISENPVRIGGAAFLCSAQFFAITNFAVWAGSNFYPHTAAGLAACYVSAIPFWGRTLAGDLLFTASIFGLHAFLSRRVAPGERPELLTA
jgi:hypothetical protein